MSEHGVRLGIEPTHTGTDGSGVLRVFPGWWCAVADDGRCRECAEDPPRDGCPSCALVIPWGGILVRSVQVVFAPVGSSPAVAACTVRAASPPGEEKIGELFIGRAPVTRRSAVWGPVEKAINESPARIPVNIGVCTRDAVVFEVAEARRVMAEAAVRRSGVVSGVCEPMPYSPGSVSRPGAPDVLAYLLGTWPFPESGALGGIFDLNVSKIATPKTDDGRAVSETVDLLRGQVEDYRAGKHRRAVDPETGERHDALLLAVAGAVYGASRTWIDTLMWRRWECPVHGADGVVVL